MSSFSHMTEGQWGTASGSFQPFESSLGEVSSVASGHVTPSSSGRDWIDPSTKRPFADLVHPENIERPQTTHKQGDVSPLDPQGDLNESDNEEDVGVKRESKRPRMAISCSECRRRKIKCDRNVPCMACVKRGVPGSCRWENAKVEPSPQPFALKTQVDDLQRRLDILQETLSALPSEIVKAITLGQQNPTASLPESKRNIDQRDAANTSFHEIRTGLSRESSDGVPPVKSSYDSAVAPNATSTATQLNGRPSKGLTEFYDDAAENAAVVLESIAFNPRTNEVGGTNESVSSHEYWRGNMLTPVSGAALAGNAKDDRSNSKQHHQNQELTSALTSILAPPPDNALDRFNPVLMQQQDFDMDNPQQLLKSRFDAMNSIFENLPSPRQSYYLAEQYKNIIHWRSPILHWPSFQAELNSFWQVVTQQRQAELDPLWLAVFFMVMALALDNRPTAPTGPDHPFHGYSHQRLDDLARKYHSVSMKALYLGDCMSTPQVRTIQAIILFNSFFQLSSAWRKADMMLNWNSLAIRTAQLMGLHRLGNNPETMPPDDPAWPPGKNAVKRYIALRVWMMLQWADWMSASARFRCYTIQPEQCTSQVTANVNEWDLSPTEWRYTPQPLNVVTASSFEVYKWQIANMLRLTFDKLITHADKFSYSTVLELDAGYRKILDGLPDAYQRENPMLDETNPKIRRQRNIALEGIHSRIVRLNRPFLSRGYSKGSKFARSRDNCLSSARIVVDCHYNLRDLTTSGSLWFVYSHTLSAAMVLFLDLFWSIDHNLPPAELDEKTRVIFMVGEIFSMHGEISNTPLRRIVESAFRIISELISESQARRSALQAHNHNLTTQQQPFTNPAPFSEVLRRISRDMSLENRNSRYQDPGSSSSQASQLPRPTYQQPPFPGDISEKAYEQMPPQDFLGSGFYNALGVQDTSDPTFPSLWNFNTSPADSQSDLSFLNVYQGVGPDVSDRYGLWQFFVGQDLL